MVFLAADADGYCRLPDAHTADTLAVRRIPFLFADDATLGRQHGRRLRSRRARDDYERTSRDDSRSQTSQNTMHGVPPVLLAREI